MNDTPRQHDRHDLGLTIDLGGEAGSSVNISAGGISVSGTYALGDVLRVTFAIAHSGLLVHTEGLVVWSEEGRSGLRFDDLDPEVRAAIDEVLHLSSG
ncbi:MAG: PilZ domain-containing protein [Myxococcota bacterium]|jgi:hypothetical protein|nr:PilZ domain-containing protein [Myxococcota bacterium]